jgi:hypothetical protein
VLGRRGTTPGHGSDLAEAERLLRDAVRFFDSPDVPPHLSDGTRMNLAQVLLRAGQDGEALTVAQETLSSTERDRGPDHPYVAEVLQCWTSWPLPSEPGVRKEPPRISPSVRAPSGTGRGFPPTQFDA